MLMSGLRLSNLNKETTYLLTYASLMNASEAFRIRYRDASSKTSHKVGRIWNALPCDEVDFSSLLRFRNSLTAKVLVRYCSLNFI